MKSVNEKEARKLVAMLDRAIEHYHNLEPFQMSDAMTRLILETLQKHAEVIERKLPKPVNEMNYEEIIPVLKGIPQVSIPQIDKNGERLKMFLHEELRPEETNEIPSLVHKILGRDFSMFLAHDISHIPIFSWEILHIQSLSIPFFSIRYLLRPDIIQDLIYGFNRRMQYAVEMMAHPFNVTRHNVLNLLGEPFPYEPVDLKPLAEKVADLIIGRSDPIQKRVPGMNLEIVVDTESSSVLGDESELFSVFYNAMKNSEKKMIEPHLKKPGNYIIRISSRDIDDDYVLITFEDNGEPVSVDAMKRLLREAILKERDIPFPSADMRERIGKWMGNPYYITEMPLGDFIEVACMAHMSGNPDSVTSGMGLWGTRYCIDVLRGALVYGENFETGGPIFGYILPKSTSGLYANATADKVKQGILVPGNPLIVR